MKFTITNNQPFRRVLPVVGSNNIIEPYGTLVFNKPKSFEKSFKSLSVCGYTVYCEEDKLKEINLPDIGDTTIASSTILSDTVVEDTSEIKSLESQNNTNILNREIKKNEEVKDTSEIKEESVTEQLKDSENPKVDEIVIEEKETRESILNKCKSLPAESLRLILKEIGTNSTSNNTNTLFNKISNSEVTDELLIEAYNKVITLKD